jgi:hypothetical protein
LNFQAELFDKYYFCFMKRILLIIFLAGLGSSLLAQSTFKNRVSLGLEGGPEFSSVHGGGLSNPEDRTAINGGVYVQYDISRVLRLSLGAYYDPRGFSTSYQSPFLILSDTGYIGYNSFYAYDMTFKADYVTFPLNITYLSGGDKFHLLVEGGIYFSVLVSSYKKGYRGIYIDPSDLPHYGDSTLTSGYHMITYDSPASDFFNGADVGLHFAFGLIYQMTDKLALTLKPGFNFGFSAIASDPDMGMKWDRIMRINLGVAYRFHPYVQPKKEYILQ